MSVPTRRLANLAVFAAAFLLPHRADAQVSMFQACSQGSMANCALIRLTTQLGIGPGGSNLFEIALHNLGSQSTPSFATSILFLAFTTGQGVAAPGTEVDQTVAPVAKGGATISDPSGWSVFESGDAIFLSALGNNGVGGCALSAPVGGFGQMGGTCGSDEFIAFNFFTPRAFALQDLVLAGLEFGGIADGNPTEGCSDATPCVITPVTATPEPGTMLLALTGLSGTAGWRLRRKTTSTSEA